MNILMYVFIAIILVGVFLVIKQTIQRKGNFGINLKAVFKPVNCPDCHEPLSRIRIPKDAREILWGGFTCQKCGKKFDKWLNELPQ